MSLFSFSIPSNIVYGTDSLLSLGNYILPHGNKVIIITEQLFYENNIISKIENILKSFNIDYLIYDEITPDSGSEDIVNISILTQTSKADMIIGLGGQKCLNIAKAVGVFGANEMSFYYYIKNPEEIKSKLPVLLIPTTPRDYFALSDSFYYKDQDIGVTKLFNHKKLVADYLLIDPVLLTHIPPKTFSMILIEMMGYAVDAIISKKSTIFTDTLLFKTIETINNNFEKLIEFQNDLSILEEISLGGLFLMIAGRISGFLLVEGLSLAINSLLKIPKTIAATIIIPQVFEYYIPSTPEKFVKFAQCLSIEVQKENAVESALKSIEHIQKLVTKYELPSRLSQFNVTKEILWRLVNHSIEFGLFINSPRVVTNEDLFKILYASL